jgi:hypothetical protein
MNEPNEDRAFAERARTLLDEDARRLDGPTLGRLRRAREEALEAGRTGRLLHRLRQARFRVAAAALTAAAAAALVLVVLPLDRSPVPPLGADPTELELLASAEGPDFYEELDFYLWIAEEQADVG